VLNQSLRTHPPSSVPPGRRLSGEGEAAAREAAARERRALVEGVAVGAPGLPVQRGAEGVPEEGVPLLLHEQLQKETLALRSQAQPYPCPVPGP
jgi:hypothetical protein